MTTVAPSIQLDDWLVLREIDGRLHYINTELWPEWDEAPRPRTYVRQRAEREPLEAWTPVPQEAL